MIGKYYLLGSAPVDILGDLDLDLGNRTVDCLTGNQWILTHFGQCLSDRLQWASFVLGFVSLTIWFFPSIPQIYENYKRGSCEEALSPVFLFLWFFGDSTNLAGAILTKQLPLQIYVGIYYIIQDCIILGQYVYYTVKHRSRGRSNKGVTTAPHSTIVNGVILGAVFFVSGKTVFRFSRSAMIPDEESFYRNRVLLAPIFNGATDEVGYAFGSVSAISYLAGRIPQLIKNYKRRSVEGVSRLMYALICLGNATYGASVLFGLDGDPLTYYARHMPWLAGSLLCLFFDSLVFVQSFLYKNAKKEDTLPIADGDSLDPSDSFNDA